MNKNRIISRMFAKASESDDKTDITLTGNERSASPMITNTRRNLFGIRLNHDQLKQDLKDMWQESIDIQNKNWGFDFEKLKPLDNDNNKLKATRFEWTKMNTKLNSFYNETELKVHESEQQDHMVASFNRNELIESSDYETEEEEYDDALVIPTFYKYQRRQKMNEEKNRLKLIQLTKSNQQQANAFSKLNNSGSASSSTQKKVVRKIIRPSPRKLTSSSSNNHQKNLIITFSENRKDTLRSALVSKSKVSKNLNSLFEEATCSLNKNIDNEETKVNSAFKQPLKQQSLLDMFKQRKRKTSTQQQKSLAEKHQVLSQTPHNLRPRATSTIN